MRDMCHVTQAIFKKVFASGTRHISFYR